MLCTLRIGPYLSGLVNVSNKLKYVLLEDDTNIFFLCVTNDNV